MSVEAFALVCKSRLCGIRGSRDRDDIDAVKVIFVPLRHEGRSAAVCGEERTGYGFDKPVLPGDDDNRVAIERLFESRSPMTNLIKALNVPSYAHCERGLGDLAA